MHADDGFSPMHPRVHGWARGLRGFAMPLRRAMPRRMAWHVTATTGWLPSMPRALRLARMHGMAASRQLRRSQMTGASGAYVHARPCCDRAVSRAWPDAIRYQNSGWETEADPPAPSSGATAGRLPIAQCAQAQDASTHAHADDATLTKERRLRIRCSWRKTLIPRRPTESRAAACRCT